MAYQLTIQDRRDSHSWSVPFTGNCLKIGKAGDNDIVLDSAAVSRSHCEVRIHSGGQIAVHDLGSRNGTFMNGTRLDRPTLFNENCVLQIGDYTVRLETAKAGAAPAPAAAAPTPAANSARAVQPRPAERKPAADNRQVTPVDLKKNIHALLIERMDLKRQDMTQRSQDELRQRTTEVCTAIVHEMLSQLPRWLAPEALVKEIVDEAVGLGCLEGLLADDTITEIMVLSWDRIYVERKGKIVLTDKQFTDNQQVIAIIRRILAPIGRRIDETTPIADGRLADGSRVNAIIPPLALSGPSLTIRKFSKTPFQITDLIKFGSMIEPMARFLELAVKNRANIIISGGTGSGKTTLLNVTSNFIPEGERIVTVEDSAELQLQQEHVVRLESRPANLEGKNAITIRDLVKNCLRMRPDRIVIGECRGGEALDMLQAMNTGHDGSLTTVHANNPRDTIGRLETLVLMAGMDLPGHAILEQIASAVNFIVQAARLADGSRKITYISEVTGMQGDVITLKPIFEFRQNGYDADGKVVGYHTATGEIPEFVQEMRKRGLDVDLSMFKEVEGK